MTKRRLFKGILLLVTLCVVYVLYLVFLSPRTNLQPVYLIPNDAVFIVESDQPVKAWQTISDGEAWGHLIKNTYFSELTSNIQKVDTVFKDQRRLFKSFDGRSLLISVHMISPKDYGVFYVLDLKRMAKLNLLRTYLNTLLNDGYTLSKRTFHEQEIYEVFDRKNKKTMYLAFIKNQLVASYTHTLVEASILQHHQPVIGRNLDFIKVNQKVGYEDLFRFYVQYAYFDDYLNQFTNRPKDWVKQISENFIFSGFHIDIDNTHITAEGFTNISEHNEAYLKALQQSGKASRTATRIAPDRTAVFLSYGFEEFDLFYDNFETVLQENPERFEQYKDGIEQTERLLKIDMEQHFFSWMGTEIAMLQLKPTISNKPFDMALLLKAEDIDNARDNLDFVIRQIRKRTPVKFKSVDFKGHTIHYLSIKGFFKMLFGAKFEEFDKPYFTIVEDFVVFSNDPNTLKSIIADYQLEQTLVHSKEFRRFNEQFETASSLFVYANVPLAMNNITAMVDAPTKIQLKKNEDFLICFPQVGFQMSPKDDLFETTFITRYEEADMVRANNYFKVESKKLEVGPGKNVRTDKNDPIDRIFDVRPIYPSDLNAKSYTANYKDGALKVKVDLKDGLKHGRYIEYYPNGEKKISGRFKENVKTGVWRYYDKNGSVQLKKRF